MELTRHASFGTEKVNSCSDPLIQCIFEINPRSTWSTSCPFIGETIVFERGHSDNEFDVLLKMTPYACLLQNPTTTFISGRFRQDENYKFLYWLDFGPKASTKYCSWPFFYGYPLADDFWGAMQGVKYPPSSLESLEDLETNIKLYTECDVIKPPPSDQFTLANSAQFIFPFG